MHMYKKVHVVCRYQNNLIVVCFSKSTCSLYGLNAVSVPLFAFLCGKATFSKACSITACVFSFPNCHHPLISLLLAVAECDHGCFHRCSNEQRNPLNRHRPTQNADPSVSTRKKNWNLLWESGSIQPSSNVQCVASSLSGKLSWR